MSEFFRIRNFCSGVLSSGVSSSGTVFPVVSTGSFLPPPFLLQVNSEYCAVTGFSGNNLLVRRGAENTTPVSHPASSFCNIVVTQGFLQNNNIGNKDSFEFTWSESDYFIKDKSKTLTNKRVSGNRSSSYEGSVWQVNNGVSPTGYQDYPNTKQHVITDLYQFTSGNDIMLTGVNRNSSGVSSISTTDFEGSQSAQFNSASGKFLTSYQGRNNYFTDTFFRVSGVNQLATVDLDDLPAIGVIPSGSESSQSTLSIDALNKSYNGKELMLYNDTDKIWTLTQKTTIYPYPDNTKGFILQKPATCLNIRPQSSLKLLYDAACGGWRPLVTVSTTPKTRFTLLETCISVGFFDENPYCRTIITREDDCDLLTPPTIPDRSIFPIDPCYYKDKYNEFISSCQLACNNYLVTSQTYSLNCLYISDMTNFLNGYIVDAYDCNDECSKLRDSSPTPYDGFYYAFVRNDSNGNLYKIKYYILGDTTVRVQLVSTWTFLSSHILSCRDIDPGNFCAGWFWYCVSGLCVVAPTGTAGSSFSDFASCAALCTAIPGTSLYQFDGDLGQWQLITNNCNFGYVPIDPLSLPDEGVTGGQTTVLNCILAPPTTSTTTVE